jgi:Tfp pilus assembly protein PilO
MGGIIPVSIDLWNDTLEEIEVLRIENEELKAEIKRVRKQPIQVPNGGDGLAEYHQAYNYLHRKRTDDV